MTKMRRVRTSKKDALSFIERFQDGVGGDAFNPTMFDVQFMVPVDNADFQERMKLMNKRVFKIKYTRKQLFLHAYEDVNGNIGRILAELDINRPFNVNIRGYNFDRKVSFQMNRAYVLEDYSVDLSWGDVSKTTVWDFVLKAV